MKIRDLFKILFDRSLDPNVENYARDQLSNERTLLAWYRTGFGLIGLALLFLRFGIVDQVNYIVGMALLCNGIVIMTVGIYRFAAVKSHLKQGQFPNTGGSVMIVTILLYVNMFSILVISIYAKTG